MQNKNADYLSRHPLHEIEQLQKDSDMVINSDNISLCNSITRAHNNPHIDISVLQLNSVDKITSVRTEQLIESQLNDDYIKPVYQFVKTKTKPSKQEWKEISYQSKLLMKQYHKLKFVKDVLIRSTSEYNQIVLPSSMQDVVYTELHKKMGHLGTGKVVELARRRFYWSGMYKDIDTYIRRKCRCVKQKRPNGEGRAPLVPIKSTYPFEIVSLDFLKLDKAKGGFEYVLVVTNHFSRYVQAFATKTKSAKAAAEKLYNNYILTYGFPSQIHHDCGREFHKSLFAKLHQLCGIKSSKTTPYHPSGDGQTERMNRTIISMLKTLNENQKAKWKDHLSKLVFTYNSTINKSTGYSPFFLMFGRSSRLPIDSIFTVDIGVTKQKTYDQFLSDWKNQMNEAIQIAQQKANKSAEQNYILHGNGIVIGDRVLLRNFSEKGGTGKLRAHWENTIYVVVGKGDNLPVYNIKPENSNGTSTKKVNRNIIMPCNRLPSTPKSNNNKNYKKISQDKSIQSDSNVTGEHCDSDSYSEIIILQP